jgi:hypothetical protein
MTDFYSSDDRWTEEEALGEQLCNRYTEQRMRMQVQCAAMAPLALYQALRVRRDEWQAILNETRGSELFWCSMGNFIWMLTFWIGYGIFSRICIRVKLNLVRGAFCV